MSGSLWGSFHVVMFNIVIFLLFMAHARAVLSGKQTPDRDSSFIFQNLILRSWHCSSAQSPDRLLGQSQRGRQYRPEGRLDDLHQVRDVPAAQGPPLQDL